MLFSVIVPVYNVEFYLDKCIQSIVTQVQCIEENCEIILIDDGSTDSSGKKCDMYALKFPNLIKVFHNPNRGLLYTRRFGYRKSCGDYIINCDSDDFIEPEMFTKISNIIEKYNRPDVIIFNYNRYDGSNKRKSLENLFTSNYDCTVAKLDIFKEFLTGNKVVSLWSKIYKRTCLDINNNYENFGKLNTGEDTLQSIEIYTNAKTFVYLNEALYNYRSESGMTCKFDKDYYITFRKIIEEIYKKKEEWNISNFDKLISTKVLQIVGRSITQSRYNKWITSKEHIDYLKFIEEDTIFRENIVYLYKNKKILQFDHYILLMLLRKRFFICIVLLLRIKNIFS